MTVNSVVLIGRLTKDVELRTTTSGTDVASFTIAVDTQSQQNNNQTLFMNCVAFGNQAKFVSTYCKKGFLIAVEGRLQQRNFERKDGSKGVAIETVCSNIQNLQPKAADSNNGISIEENAIEEEQNLSYSDDDLPF